MSLRDKRAFVLGYAEEIFAMQVCDLAPEISSKSAVVSVGERLTEAHEQLWPIGPTVCDIEGI